MQENLKSKIAFALRIVAAAVLLQTLFFKFTGAPESRFIFSTLGIEPWGRFFAGISELIASVLILIPMTQVLGAAMALGIMLGAVASHVLILGIVIQDDGGLLFALALLVSACSLGVLVLRKNEIPVWIERGLKLLPLNKK